MLIDTNALNVTGRLELDTKVEFSDTVYQNSPIKRLANIIFKGLLYYNSADELLLEGNLKGEMILEDAISLADIGVPINIELKEIIDINKDNKQNTLELSDYLWQNIVLEVPIALTKVKDKNLSGDGWELKEGM